MKGYLLDTHALMWAINEPARLGGKAVEVLRDRGNLVVVSAASAWELHTKNRIGKLPGAGPWLDALEGHVRRLGAEFLPIEWSHRDPFDRMLAAQAMYESLALVTRDPAFEELSGVTILW